MTNKKRKVILIPASRVFEMQPIEAVKMLFPTNEKNGKEKKKNK